MTTIKEQFFRLVKTEEGKSFAQKKKTAADKIGCHHLTIDNYHNGKTGLSSDKIDNYFKLHGYQVEVKKGTQPKIILEVRSSSEAKFFEEVRDSLNMLIDTNGNL